MATLRALYLAVQTRDERGVTWEGSKDRLRLFSGTNASDATEVVRFGAPPPPGKAGLFMRDGLNLSYEDFLLKNTYLGLTGDDAWAHRSTFLWGQLEDAGVFRYVPLGMYFWGLPGFWLSEGGDPGSIRRWPLKRMVESPPEERLSYFLLHLETGGSGAQAPFELSVFTRIAGVPALVHQTLLSRMGTQTPAEPNGSYLALLQADHLGIHPGGLLSARVDNRSDEAWSVKDAWLFAVSIDNTRGRFLGRAGAGLASTYSQDPQQAPESGVEIRGPALTAVL